MVQTEARIAGLSSRYRPCAPGCCAPPRQPNPQPPNVPHRLLQDTTDATRLQFLPHHFLLCSVGTGGVLRYQDTSTGRIVAQHRTKQGPCDALCQNPWNAVLCLGHGNGTVTLWTPNVSTPVVRMLCHHGPVRALAADSQGRHLVTTGADGQVGSQQSSPCLPGLLRRARSGLQPTNGWDGPSCVCSGRPTLQHATPARSPSASLRCRPVQQCAHAACP